MSAFWTFFAILTAAYAVYYAVIISGDLHRERKAGRHSSGQVFVVEGDSPIEATRSVEQTDGGFRVSGEEEKTPGIPTPALNSSPAPAGAGEKKEEDAAAPRLDAHGAVVAEVMKKIGTVKEGMEEIEPEQSTELLSGMMQSAMLHGRPPVDIEK